MINIRWVFTAGLLLMVIGIVIHFSLRSMLGQFIRTHPTQAPLISEFPEPRLQPGPTADLKRLRAEEARHLQSYGWIDQKAQVARIPIDRAMNLYLEKRANRHPDSVSRVGFDQKLGARIPLALEFRSEVGPPLSLRDAFAGKPGILVLAYYGCPNLCTLVLNGLVNGLQAMNLVLGSDYSVVTVSINPRETSLLAHEKQIRYTRLLGKRAQPQAWHFLTGSISAIRSLTDAVGFRYQYDSKTREFQHDSGIIFLSPEGKISSYLFGIHFEAKAIQEKLQQAALGRIGSPIERLLMLCFHYDPQAGKYGSLILNAIRWTGIGSVLLMLGAFLRLRKP